MANSYYKGIIYKDAVHRPLGTEERFTTDSIPISGMGGNQIRGNPDGLYVGPYGLLDVYYVDDVDGNDTPEAIGTKESPLKTLDYAMERIWLNNAGDPQLSYTVALKAGGTFAYTRVSNISGNVVFTFYDDPQYGSFNSPTVGQMATHMPADLLRPIINVGLDPTSNGGIGCFVLNPPNDGSRSRITFSGVRVNLPPDGAYNTGQGSLVVANQKTDGFVVLEGTIINAVGDTSIYGFLSVLPSATIFLYQFGSQFRVDDTQIGAQPTPPPTPAQLARRKWFIRMHPDFAATVQTGYDPGMISASPGSGLLSLSWTDTPIETSVVNVTAQNSWPVLEGASFGFGQYVNVLRRDNQGRPLNVLSGRAF